MKQIWQNLANYSFHLKQLFMPYLPEIFLAYVINITYIITFFSYHIKSIV